MTLKSTNYKKISILALILIFSVPLICSSKTSSLPNNKVLPKKENPVFYVSAHPDDWQIFIGNKVYNDVKQGRKVVIIYTTAGDAGREESFWRSRELAANTSVEFLVDGSLVDDEKNNNKCSFNMVNNHSLWRCTYGKVTSYWLRLPDGTPSGQGTLTYQRQSLKKFYQEDINSLQTVDKSSTYSSWEDLTKTITQLINKEKLDNRTSYSIYSHSYKDVFIGSPGDHSDHIYSGKLIFDLTDRFPVKKYWYSGYNAVNQPINLSDEDVLHKLDLFMSFERAMLYDISHSTYSEAPKTYFNWLVRTYYYEEGSSGLNELRIER